jgi:hypothetical protein
MVRNFGRLTLVSRLFALLLHLKTMLTRASHAERCGSDGRYRHRSRYGSRVRLGLSASSNSA